VHGRVPSPRPCRLRSQPVGAMLGQGVAGPPLSVGPAGPTACGRSGPRGRPRGSQTYVGWATGQPAYGATVWRRTVRDLSYFFATPNPAK
jgi:hypothetical protein